MAIVIDADIRSGSRTVQGTRVTVEGSGVQA